VPQAPPPGPILCQSIICGRLRLLKHLFQKQLLITLGEQWQEALEKLLGKLGAGASRMCFGQLGKQFPAGGIASFQFVAVALFEGIEISPPLCRAAPGKKPQFIQRFHTASLEYSPETIRLLPQGSSLS